MVSSPHYAIRSRVPTHQFDAVKGKIAQSLVGSAVNVLAGTKGVLHGKVLAVQFEAGSPKLLVAGMSCDLDQVLTVTPAGLTN